MRIQTRMEEKNLRRRLAWLRWVSWLSKHVRKERVSRLCNRSFYLGDDPGSSLKFIVPYHRRLLLHVDTNSWLERWILNRDYYEPELVRFLDQCLKPGMVAFDVGANVGCHTLVMANAVGATGRVMAFEPNPAIFERLRANLCLNRFTQVETVPLCLSDRAGRQTLFAPLDDDYNQGLASVHRENLDRRSRAIEVRSVTLDDFVSTRALERLDLLKIDVEGHEFQVLRGARQVLQQLRPLLVLEFSERQWENAGVRPCQLEDYLGELGYSLFVLREHSITGLEHGVCQECNLLAIPQPLPAAAPPERTAIRIDDACLVGG